MPLVRVEVRNEYGLGLHELYGEANREDPKAVLDGVAVAGLVGILRQLGDLAEFAAEVFHGLQEQVTTAASRSHKLLARVQHIEAALPLLEKSILAQRSHIHFAYTAGSNWHASIPTEQNHFICHDLPRFIMDSYEECHDPPRLHLLDKFDNGGPGSCLKRYSDPTFFRRAAAGSEEANAEKVQRDKARRIKKKRSLLRNGEVSRSVSISNRSGRVESTSSNVHGQTSPAQTVSTVDMPLKSDLKEHSNSFDSRTESGYIECVFHLSSSFQTEEQQCKGSSSSLKMQSVDTFDSALPDAQTRLLENDFPHSSPQEQTGHSSSCVTWDEKTEIVEPKGQDSDGDEASKMLQTICDLETPERAPISLRNVDQMDILLVDANSPKSILGGNQIDEIESETDNYVDALNTIDSEFESDFDCQTKREVEQYSNLTNGGTKDRDYKIEGTEDRDYKIEGTEDRDYKIEGTEDRDYEIEGTEDSDYKIEGTEDRDYKIHESEHHVSNLESCTTSHSSSNQGLSLNSPNSVPSACLANEQTTLAADKSPHSESSPMIEASAALLNGSKRESVIGNLPSSTFPIPNSQGPMDDKVRSSFCESRDSSADVSSVHSVKFWTNGGLLGLEPSKPPDFRVSNPVNPDSHPSTCSVMQTGGPPSEKLDRSVENSLSIEKDMVSKCSTSHPGNPEDDASIKKKSWGFSLAGLYTKPENLNVSGPVTPRTELPVIPNETISTETNKKDNENSSRGYGLGHALLMNGFRRNVSLVEDEKSESVSSAKSNAFEETSKPQSVSYRTYPETGFKKQFGHESPVNSLPSSPPLEQMKISFHPINGFETSKLKLKFPDGSHSNESIRDMFPSFQLVPEPVASLQDMDFDSDDDTFCQSSPCMSDDCLSHHSESNSEQWESGETPTNKDHELYDALCRVQSTESVSSSQELVGPAHGTIHVDSGHIANGVEPSQSGLLLDLPSFDVVNPLLKQEIKHDSNPRVLPEGQYPKQSMPPPPPPLPPLQWRVLKPQSDVVEENQHAVSEALDHLFDLTLLKSTDCQRSEPVLARQQQSVEANACKPNSKVVEKQDRKKSSGQKEMNQAANGKRMDEREDFLEQIRTKSFSLRRTVTPRPTVMPTPTTNVSVTAILEKANAIRQAVGSDDGEDDDNWSDT